MIRIQTLGTLRVFSGQQEVELLLRQKLRCAFLVFVAAERETTRELAAGMFWGEREPERGRHLVSQTLYELRRTFGDHVIEGRGDRLRAGDVIDLDVQRLEDAAAVDDAEKVVRLYHGPFLHGFHLAESQPFEEWAERRAARLARLHRRARKQLIDARRQAQDASGALSIAREWVEIDPLDDEAQHNLIDLLARVGERTAALEQFDRYARLLSTQLDLKPLEETRALIESIRSADPSGPGTALAPVAPRESPQPELAHAAEPAAPSAARDRVVRRLRVPLAAVAAIGALALLLRQGDREPHTGVAAPTTFVVPRFAVDDPVADSAAAHGAWATLVSGIELLTGAHPLAATVGGHGASGIDATGAAIDSARTAGATYLLRGRVHGARDQPALSVELYDVQAGATVRTLRGGSGTESLERAAGRMAIEFSAAIAQLHGRRFPPAYVREDTHSPVALAHLLEGQSRFWNAEIDAAAEAYGRAIAADSAFGAAYARLSAVESWGTRWDHAAARRVADTGLRQRNRLAPRWIEVLEARRHYAMREIDAAVQAFDRMKVNHADLADAWFGLSESVFELSAFHGHDPRNARAAFDRLVALDSTFAPIYHRLVMLALWDGDTAAARRYHRRMPPRFPDRDAYGYLVELWSDPAGSGAVLQQLGRADTRTISIVIGELSRDDRMLPLIDTIAGFLLNTRRSADDRVRGAHYRMLATAGTPRWDETLRLLDNAGGAAFDEWIVFAALAGYDVGGRADRFLSRADSLLDAGDLPDFSRWPNDDAQRRFQALVHRASLTGDSAHATRLARLLERAAVTADASNPLPDALRGSLEARLALLAADTGRAIRSLDHALARVLYPWWFYPIYAMAPQRLLLAELLRARGQRLEADRWLQSFSTSGFVGDGLYRRRQSAIAGAVRRSHAANLPHSPGGRNGSEPER